ncbi:histone PARylation factor 1-like isoform X1 [Rhopilema esculentum]|uniref:histone PARylation factor 1-like isoform X1 n=1 Tax=Rhopilema esculentum TaxID=499914 RepID=UPI0031D7528A
MAGKSKRGSSAKNSSSGQVSKKRKIGKDEEEESTKKIDCETKEKFHENMKKALRMEMPDDFFEFYEFCKSFGASHVHDALSELLGLQLCGPYDLLHEELSLDTGTKGLVQAESSGNMKYHLNSRFYFDPPEVMTVVRESSHQTGLHLGYFRDSPNELPSLVVSNRSEEDCVFTQCGDNIFAAVCNYAGDLLKSTKNKAKKEKIEVLLVSLKEFAQKYNHSLQLVTVKTQKRSKMVVAKTFHKMGLVVPLDGSGVGYRPLNLADNALRKVLTKICKAKNEDEKNKCYDDLHELITFVQFANDECDYGMGLELGIDLFCFGNEAFKQQVLQLLPLAYSLLGRELYAEIIEKHMQNREKPFVDQVIEET